MLALVRLLVEVHDLASSVQVKSNRPFSDEPEVSGRMPLFGQSLPLRHSVCTDNYLCQFQSGVRGPVPLDSSFAHPSTFGECLDRVLGVGPELVQAQHSFGRIGGGGGVPEVAQAPAVLRRPSVSLWPQLGLSWFFCKLRGRRTMTVAR